MGYILVVEDEIAVADHLGRELSKRGLKVLRCTEYNQTVHQIENLLRAQKENTSDVNAYTIDVMICDLNIKPLQSKKLESIGFQLLKYIKQKSPQTHCIVYTGLQFHDVTAKCVGLGDRYFQKTTCPGRMDHYQATVPELAEYVHHYLSTSDREVIAYLGGLAYNFTLHTAVLNGEPLNLKPFELDLIEVMIRDPDKFFDPSDLYSIIVKTQKPGLGVGAEAHVRDCMRKLNQDLGGHFIIQRRGLGYCMDH